MADVFLVGIPVSFRPKLKEFMEHMEKLGGRKFGIRETVCMILAKGIGAPYLYEDIIRDKEANKAIRKEETKKRRSQRIKEAKANKAKERMMKKVNKELETTMDDLIYQATALNEHYDEVEFKPIKPKRKRRTKAEMEAFRLEEARKKAMKHQPETFMTDVPK